MTVRRYVSATTGENLRNAWPALFAGPVGKTFNIYTEDTTEWIIVPDDDPRVDTIERTAAPYGTTRET